MTNIEHFQQEIDARMSSVLISVDFIKVHFEKKSAGDYDVINNIINSIL